MNFLSKALNYTKNVGKAVWDTVKTVLPNKSTSSAANFNKAANLIAIQSSIQQPKTTYSVMGTQTAASTPSAVLRTDIPGSTLSYYQPQDVRPTNTPGLFLPNTGSQPVNTSGNVIPQGYTPSVGTPRPSSANYNVNTGMDFAGRQVAYTPQQMNRLPTDRTPLPALSGVTGETGAYANSTIPMVQSGNYSVSPNIVNATSGPGGTYGFGSTIQSAPGSGPNQSMYPSTEDDKEKKEEDKRVKRLNTVDQARQKLTAQGFRDPLFFGTDIDKLYATDKNGNILIQQGGVQSFLNQPSGVIAPGFKATPTGDEINFSAAEMAAKGVSDYLRNSNIVPTAQQFNSIYQTIKSQIMEQLDATQPPIENPVVDTPEQIEYLNQFPKREQISIKSQMDSERQRLGLPVLEGDRIKKMKELTALNEAFNKIVEDIKTNPELPKGLARRRIEEFTKTNDVNIKRLQGDLDILQQQISDANNALNMSFNIAKAEQGDYYDRERLDLERRRVQLAEKTAKQGTSAQKLSGEQGLMIQSLEPTLESTMGRDGYIDPNAYYQARQQYVYKFGNPSGFDNAFRMRLHPQERARLGLGGATGVEALGEQDIDSLISSLLGG